jgi:hypothetical protein
MSDAAGQFCGVGCAPTTCSHAVLALSQQLVPLIDMRCRRAETTFLPPSHIYSDPGVAGRPSGY